MAPKPTKTKKLKNGPLENSKILDNCEVSKASNEIMLDRFYNGKVIQFPFS